MRIECLSSLSDNYIFGLFDPETVAAAVVDPGDAAPVLTWLDRVGGTLTAILVTHHHWDHVTGIDALCDRVPGVRVYASDRDRGRIPHQTDGVRAGDRVSVCGREARVLFLPGHTRAHVAYYFPPAGVATKGGGEGGELFCGDVLFAGGCGRIGEGTPDQMFDALEQLRSLPDGTRLWCAHEYTLSNLKFALTVDGDNPALRSRFEAVTALRSQQRATIPSTLGLEKQTNPFLRTAEPALQRAVGGGHACETFTRLRQLKDRF